MCLTYTVTKKRVKKKGDIICLVEMIKIYKLKNIYIDK